ncbi:MAG: glycoside hydrolase family 130 protein [Spirochaetota bacterium]|mgnify:CR=1 FL=1
MKRAIKVTRIVSPMLVPDSARIVIRPFMPPNEERIRRVIAHVRSLDTREVHEEISRLTAEFGTYNRRLPAMFDRHFSLVEPYAGDGISTECSRLIGAYFTCEYSFESAALFNPSVVIHPDQSGVREGALRYIMSARSVGEGHVSSISFRTGMLNSNGTVTVEAVSRAVARAELVKNARYEKKAFVDKLREMGFWNNFMREAILPLHDHFTLDELSATVAHTERSRDTQADMLTAEKMIWLARSNYEIQFDEHTDISERLIFPSSPTEQNGIEDARFVRFTDDDGSIVYYATYTAYDGKIILPQIIETRDFRHFKMITLNGKVVENKGMALFPRKISGRYAMLSRQDNENIYIMFSDHLHFWHEATLIARPAAPWEFIQIGNCGSPIETDAGWLVLTHGVGTLRKYSIGAMLLDKDDPTRVIGRLDEPLISPEGNERIGYVPNVVYTCGSIVHAGRLIIPYGIADKAIGFASVSLNDLLGQLK